jgi:hypothetical protein
MPLYLEDIMGLLNDLGQMMAFFKGFRLFECTLWLFARSPFFVWLGPSGHAGYLNQDKVGYSGLLAALPHYLEEEQHVAGLLGFFAGLMNGSKRVSHC